MVAPEALEVTLRAKAWPKPPGTAKELHKAMILRHLGVPKFPVCETECAGAVNEKQTFADGICGVQADFRPSSRLFSEDALGEKIGMG
jgi:hypothetical protein